MYIALVSEFGLILGVLDCFLAHQLMMAPLKSLNLELSEHLSDISLCMICITICVKEVGVLLSFSDFCMYCFEVTLVGNIFSFMNWYAHEIGRAS